MTVYSETCINQSCSKGETLLKRTNTFDLVCFLYASLKRKLQRGHCFRRATFFQSSDKNVTCFTRIQINVLGIFEKQRINLGIVVNFLKKKRFFLHFKTVFFFYFVLQFLKESNTSEYNSAY